MSEAASFFERPKKSIRFSLRAVNELEKAVESWFAQGPYYRTVYEDLEAGQQHIKYVRKIPFPEEIEDTATHALVTLKHAFDQITWASVRCVNSRLKETDMPYFPWADTLDGAKKRLAGKRCQIPEELTDIFLSAKPYGTGDGHTTADDICRSLSKVANRKHSVGIVPAIVPHSMAMPSSIYIRRAGSMSIFPKQRWQPMKNEGVVMSLPLGTEVQGQEQVKFYVAFYKTPPMDGENVISCLRAFLAKAESSLEIIERKTLEFLGE